MATSPSDDAAHSDEPEHRALDAARDDSYRERVALLTAVFETAPFFVAVTRGADHVFVMANPAYRGLVGGRDLVGRRVAEAIPEAMEQGFIDRLDQVFETGKPHTASETPVELDDEAGRRRQVFLDFVYQPLLDADGVVTGIHVHGTDVTEQVRTRAEVEEKEARFRTVLESALDAAYRRDLVTDSYDYMSPVIEDLVGFSPREMEKMSQQEVLRRIHPDDLEAVRAGIEEGTTTGKGIVEYRFEGKDGAYRWLADHFTVHVGEGGQPRYRSGVVRDITDRKRVEDELRQSEERFRTLADNIAQLAWMADANGWIFWYNRRWFEYTGTTLPEMEGWGWRKVHHPDHIDRVVEKLSRCFERGEPWEDTFPLRRHDGAYRWFLARALPIRDASGDVVRWFGTNTDVTERLELERSLADLNATLEDRVRDRTEQVHELAARLTIAEQEERRRVAQILHDDLQQQLYALEMRLGMIEEVIPEDTDERIRAHMDVAYGLVEESVKLTRDLTSDLSPPVLQSEALADMLKWLTIRMHDRHGLEVELQADHAFRTQEEDLRILLFQIVRELLFNVTKHADADRVVVRLQQAAEGHVEIQVIDDGVGFDAEAVEERGGYGFGLSSARERLALFGGRMHIHSAPGEGTRVVVEAPLRRRGPSDAG